MQVRVFILPDQVALMLSGSEWLSGVCVCVCGVCGVCSMQSYVRSFSCV